jgi:hypothetical protein
MKWINVSEFLSGGKPLPRTYIVWDVTGERGELHVLDEKVYSGGFMAPYRETGRMVTARQSQEAELALV